jgi:probable metal-binding protein
MSDTLAIHGHDIIDLVSQHPDGIRLGRLMEMVEDRFGKSVTFHTCSAAGMDLDGLLHFLEARDKVRITAGTVFPGGSPACEH